MDCSNPIASRTVRRAAFTPAVALAGLCYALPARAVDPPAATGALADPMDYVTPRFEPAGFPLIGGNSDTGLLFGVAGTLTHFSRDIRPYQWNMDLVLALSVKDGPDGAELTQHSLLWQLDLPGLLGGRLRLNPKITARHVINQGYFGLGNASSPDRPGTAMGNAGRYFQSVFTDTHVRMLARVSLGGPWSAGLLGGYRYVAPTVYGGSQLQVDGAARSNGEPLIRGLEPLSLVYLALGMMYDTRDSELLPTRGIFSQASVRVVQALPVGSDVHYVSVAGSLAGYIPLGGPFVLASRVVADVMVGNAPFYDLYWGGPFVPNEMLGGAGGIRGVPSGRYLGQVKILGNLELRAMLGNFTVLHQHFRYGADLFFDTGRVWSDLTFTNPLDGTGIGLKYGVGAGVYLRWGQAAIFRVEAAWSPDAAAENANFPVGIYVEDGVMF